MKQSLPLYRLIYLLLFSVVFNGVSAQMANTYTYSYSSPTYTYITGTSLATGVSSWDDNVYTNIPIGFTFYFEGLPYTTIGVSSNGFIWFGTGTASTTEYNPISDATLGTGTINGVVAGYANNLIAYPSTLSSAQTGSPSITYATSGTGCSQAFTVQWKGTYVSGTSTGELFGDLERVDLQIVLNETTNTIGILVHINPYPYDQSSTGEVGIRGATNSDFTSLTCWTAGCSQTTNAAATAKADPSYPATKSEFTFTPPACTYTAATTSTNASCGNNGTITINVTNGTGLFAYDINNGTAADTNLTGLFSGLGAGTYTTAVSNGICAVSGCTTLSSNVTNATATNTGPACVGGTVTLQTPTVSGATYSWTGPNGYTSSLQNPVLTNVTIADSGTYTIVDTVGGCAGGSGTTHVTINGAVTAPKVASNSPICAGATLDLIDSTTGGTYSWTGPNSYTSTSQSPSIANAVVADSGTYSVVNTVSGCTSSPVTVHVVVNPTPVAPKLSNNGPLCTGGNLVLMDSTSGATYSWTGPNSFTSHLQNPGINNVVVADSGSYIATDTIAGCVSPSTTMHVSILPSLATPVLSSNSPVCLGDTLKITSTAVGSAYAWTGPNGYTSAAQNPVIPNSVFGDSGYYKLVVSSGTCSTGPDSIRISIGAVPATPSGSSNSPVCPGSPVDLNAGNITNASYSWSGPQGYSSNQPNPVIANATSADSGIYVVIATIGSCSSAPDSVIVSIGSAPALTGVSSNSPICSGDTLNLSAPSLAGATYSWTGPNSFSDTSQNPAITDIATGDTGNYIIVAHYGICTTVPDTVHVQVNPLPVPVLTASPATICSSDSSHVCVTQSYVSYGWNGITSNTQCIYVNAAGNYYITVTDANGCTAQSSQQNSVSISVFSVSSVSIIEKGDTLATFGGNGYQWFRNDTLIQGATQSIYIVPVTGEYSVALTDTNGCIASSSQVPVTITSVGINEVNAAFNFSVYPNPASGSFNIVYTGADDKNIQLNMYNILGQAVKQENLSFSNGKNKAVDISTLPKGVYLLQFMQQGGQLLTKKLVVQ